MDLGECVYHRDFKRPYRQLKSKSDAASEVSSISGAAEVSSEKRSSAGTQSARDPLTVDDDAKLVFGVVFSLRNMVTKLVGEKEQFFAFRTTKYKLHFYETQTNLRLVMITDLKVDGLRPILEQIYAGLYVEYVVKNPLSPIFSNGVGIDNELFSLGLDRFLRPLAIFE
ncbi:Sybindin-like protein [Dipodascopsis uninucleata]